MKEEIIISGFGGQGILLAGKVLADAAMREGKNVMYMPSYGAEVRGGTAFCYVIISDRDIPSPVVSNPDTAIILNEPSKLRFEGKIKRGGLMLLNTSMTDDEHRRDDIDYICTGASEKAKEMGNERAANMILLGAYSGRKNMISIDALINSFNEMYGHHHKKKELFILNEKALREGWARANEKD
ncbi:2-oxoacid:acceptor oxidoreductase family protein [Candidatus Auribacterota bacterium]